MPVFAPPYHPPKQQQSFLARQQKNQLRKRKREDDASDESDATTPQPSSPSPEPTPQTAASAFHPVNRTDPFYIAGHARELPLPPPPFPHAAVKGPDDPNLSIEEELAGLKPPLYLPPTPSEDKSTSLKRRHLDNLTAILHQCMRKGDWERAHRAWGLLIRTEVNGRGIDVRRHGRWGIGAELLMRRGANEGRSFSDEGFQLARSYYERLILQYPHTQHTQHHLNATAIYPALFNVWTYGAQDRARREREDVMERRAISEDSEQSIDSERRRHLRRIREDELDEANAIAARIDELVFSPPYDTDATLLQLRGMVALWMADLQAAASQAVHHENTELSDISNSDVADSIAVDSHRQRARQAKGKAREIFAKLDARGVDLPGSTRLFLEHDEDEDG